MFERILYIISEKQEEKHTVMEFARRHQSTVLLTAVSPVSPCPPPLQEGETRQAVRQEEHERRCWQDIYRLEDEFKKSGIKSSVVAQLGTIDNIRFLANSTHCDLIILPTSVLAEHDYRLPEELLPNLPCPIFFLPGS
ncbi:MAG: hypothetical protein ABIK39_02740 [candidate division WOR-3 bacterium]